MQAACKQGRLKECLGAIMSFKWGSSQDRLATKFSFRILILVVIENHGKIVKNVHMEWSIKPPSNKRCKPNNLSSSFQVSKFKTEV